MKGALFTLRSSSKQLSGCGEGFPGSWREGWPPCSLPPRFAPPDWPHPLRRVPWHNLGTQVVAEPPVHQDSSS